jgi:hypothetical protein
VIAEHGSSLWLALEFRTRGSGKASAKRFRRERGRVTSAPAPATIPVAGPLAGSDSNDGVGPDERGPAQTDLWRRWRRGGRGPSRFLQRAIQDRASCSPPWGPASHRICRLTVTQQNSLELGKSHIPSPSDCVVKMGDKRCFLRSLAWNAD